MEEKGFSIDYIEFKGVSFGFESQDSLFKNLDCWFPTDQNVWITSKGDPGRTCLLKLLAGIYSPNDGNYFLNDLNISDMSFEEFLPYRLKIGYGFDNGGLLSNRTLLQNVVLPVRYHEIESAEEANRFGQELLDLFEIGEFANQRPADVTPSIRKCALLARAFIMRPEMVVLDDPDDSMDVAQLKKLIRLIKLARQFWGLRHVFFSARRRSFGELLATSEIEITKKSIIYRNLPMNNVSGL